MKYRKPPASIKGYEALLKRLPHEHPKKLYVQESLNQIRAGIGGEFRFDEMMEFFDPPYPYVLIQGIELPEKCQVDSLLITQGFVFLFEVKNISGLTRYTQQPSGFQKVLSTGEIRGMKNPLIQVANAKMKMARLLRRLGVELPIYTAVVVAYPSQRVENAPPDANIWSAEEAVYRISSMNMPTAELTSEEMINLGRHLIEMECEYVPFPLAARYQIPTEEILSGTFCPRCNLAKMTLNKRLWTCHHCQFSTQRLSGEMFDEWFMLANERMTSKECQRFFELPNVDIARRIIKQYDCISLGSRKKREYMRAKEKSWT